MINPENAIEVCNVTKYFKVYADKGSMLRERIANFSRNKYEKRRILEDVSFNIKKGEAVALIGKNGCGKSTTLKLLTRILRPNGGKIEEQGRVSSLIELGAGFHPDLTGRENIYINASIFGIKAKEVDRRIDDIISFSELEDYIDNPVRTYSSGMYMRLAFSVAINVEADILLIDEILAVGDQAFQTKCFNKLKSLKDEGVTIVLVSHSLEQVQKICDRAIWIEKGHIRNDGPAREICKEYLEAVQTSRKERIEKEAQLMKERSANNSAGGKRTAEEEKMDSYLSCRDICDQCGPDARRGGNGDARFINVELLDTNNDKRTVFKEGEALKLTTEIRVIDASKKLNVVIGITRDDWVFCYGVTSYEGMGEYLTGKNQRKLQFCIDDIRLGEGNYFFDLWIKDENREELDSVHNFIEFSIVKNAKNDHGIVSMPNSWNEID